MLKPSDFGEDYALAFYSPTLHVQRPDCTFAFAERIRWTRYSRTVNILWHGDMSDVPIEEVQKLWPDALYKGVIGTSGILAIKFDINTDKDMLLGMGFAEEELLVPANDNRLRNEDGTLLPPFRMTILERLLSPIGPKIPLHGFENGPIDRALALAKSAPEDPRGTAVSIPSDRNGLEPV